MSKTLGRIEDETPFKNRSAKKSLDDAKSFEIEKSFEKVVGIEGFFLSHHIKSE